MRYKIGLYEYDASSGELQRDGENGLDRAMRLRPQTAAVLNALLERAGDVVLRSDLQQTVWPDDPAVAEQGLNACMRDIRAALRDRPNSPSYIETLPRRGYRFVAPVSRLRDGSPEATPVDQRG